MRAELLRFRIVSGLRLRNCGAIATLSTFLNSATLRSGLLGRIRLLHSTWGAFHDHRSLDTEWPTNGYRTLCHQRSVLSLPTIWASASVVLRMKRTSLMI